jgi:hypothetical protein
VRARHAARRAKAVTPDFDFVAGAPLYARFMPVGSVSHERRDRVEALAARAGRFTVLARGRRHAKSRD